MTHEEYIQHCKEQMAGIEDCLRRFSDRELKTFRKVNALLAVWQECDASINNTQYPQCAPDWFYPYINAIE